MPAGAVANQAGPSTPVSSDKKAKRPRKRSRNKKRTTEVDDDSSSSSDDSDNEEPAPKPAPVATPVKEAKKDSKTVEADSDSDDDDKHEDGAGGEGDAKRKRKRKRNTRKKAEDAPKTDAAAPAIGSAVASTLLPAAAPVKPLVLSPEENGPDPATDLRLSDQAKQAIQYAQIYIKDKAQWKFNKAKQNWLLRNALSVPPSDYDAALARKQPASTGDAAEEAEDAEEGENFVPEDFVPVVTAYLTSVMGGARQRLIVSLREAINAPVVTVAPIEAEVTDTAAATNEQGAAATAANGSATKSVSFGNLALETEKKEEAAEAAGLPAGTDPASVELRRSRATLMLQHMGETL